MSASPHPLRAATAITGLGLTDMGRVYRSPEDLAIESIWSALDDAGLEKADVDGLLISSGISQGVGLRLPHTFGSERLNLCTQINAFGSTAGQMIQYAAMAVHSGLARHVACVFADAPLREGVRTGAAYSGAGRSLPRGMSSLYLQYGYGGAIPYYATAARRHMDLFGTTQDQLGSIAVSSREWARMNPRAQKREPLTLDEYHASPWVVEPFHVLDCCLVSNGAVCAIVSSAERARDMAQPPVFVHGMAQAHQFERGRSTLDGAISGPGGRAAETAFGMAGASVDDVTMCELYDCYTYTVLATLEDYGFCEKGEGGAFVEDGRLGPGGALPTNTGGGELSSYYMWGMTPISEAVIQGRGQAGERQVEANDLILVTGNGGTFTFHSSLLLSPHAS